MYCISIHYKKAPLEVRSRFAFTKEEQLAFLKKCRQSKLENSVLISTCNRMELYTDFEDTRQEYWELMEEMICQAKGVPVSLFRKYGSYYSKEKALRHLYRVCSGVDSMVMGEDEILGQIKNAYLTALDLGTTNFALNTIFKGAITCAKKIKTDTGLSKTSVSIATLATGFIANFLKENGLEHAKILIIGITGEIGSTVMKNIRSLRGVTIYGTSRQHNADGTVIGIDGVNMIFYKERYECLAECDVIVSATGSPHYTIVAEDYNRVRQSALRALRAPARVLMLDLSVPADIDKKVEEGELALYQLDYFRKLAKSNNEKKLQAKESAELMILEHLEKLKKELYFHQLLPRLPKYVELSEKLRFDQIMYRVRAAADYEEMKGFFKALEKVWLEEQR